jgi:hypothetical protein
MKPRAREDGLVVRELEDETLVYDLERHRAHCLNASAARVWRLCDGTRDAAEIAAQLEVAGPSGAAVELVWLALDQLGRRHLLRERITRRASPRSRREIVRRLGVAAAVPLVASILAPTAVEAGACSQGMNRPKGCPCRNSGQCLPGHQCVAPGVCN